jgi:outer membrane protein OmpA-like peptidoglycan-associated protein
MLRKLTLCAIFLLPLSTLGQENVTPIASQSNTVPVYRAMVVDRTIVAISYRNRGGSTRIDFNGTNLSPKAEGSAEVQSKKGDISIEAEFKHLPPAVTFGSEYMTYVLWAISPEGRPANLGELLLDDGGEGKLHVTSNLQAFGLIVTAEPYFAVTQPSDVVVLENTLTNKTQGTIEQVNAKYELLQRGEYIQSRTSSDASALTIDKNVPIELLEAQNAVRIAEWSGAAKYAADSLNKAKTDLQNAEQFQESHGDRKTIVTAAREAAQTAEDARSITVKKLVAEEQAQQAAQTNEAQNQAARANQEKSAAQVQATQAKAQAAQAEAQATQAQAQTAQAQVEAQDAQARAHQAENEKAAIRAKLLQQLNAILQTRDTPRGLVVNMQDILFESGQYKLKPDARVALAKIAGVLLAYPGVTIEIDGYTDNRGSEQTNETLSDKRAEAVEDFLRTQSVPDGSVSARGLGAANPIATNDTPIGRQLNRRVELVLSGDVIGTPVSASTQNGGANR